MYKIDAGEPLKQLIADIVKLKQNEDAEGIVKRLERMTEDPEGIIASMPKFDVDEVLLYVDDYVTVYYIATTPGLQYPPHEHGMIAISALYKGTETHTFYDEEGDNVKERSKVVFEAPAVIDLDIDCIHAICTYDAVPNEGLHFYLGDLEGRERRLWDVSGQNPRQYVHQDYMDSSLEIN